jgi:NAD(P)-dependent dehydrogenase (short-subunit alcohol dehydrogenase family)
MRIVVIGATGTIGKAVVEALGGRHEVVQVANSKGELRVDLAAPDSVRALFAKLGEVDAVVCAAGRAVFGPLDKLSDDDFKVCLSNKLMGQVNVLRAAVPRLREGGSITLTSGVLAREPTPGSAAISLVNSALEGFVAAAALEMPRGIRANVVSPPWVRETLIKMGRDGAGGMPAAKVAAAYVASVEGRANGKVIDARSQQ